MSIASDYLMDNVIQSILTQTPIKKYFNNRFISYSDLEKEKLWTEEELKQEFAKLQKENPSEYGHLKFGEYLKNCMWYNNGTLEEVKL